MGEDAKDIGKVIAAPFILPTVAAAAATGVPQAVEARRTRKELQKESALRRGEVLKQQRKEEKSREQTVSRLLSRRRVVRAGRGRTDILSNLPALVETGGRKTLLGS